MTAENHHKKTIQLVFHNAAYAESLAGILFLDGEHDVHVTDRPDPALDGIVVAHEDGLEGLIATLCPERIVLVARQDTRQLERIWDAGIRYVVFEETALQSLHLAILGAELKLGRGEAGSGEALADPAAGRA